MFPADFTPTDEQYYEMKRLTRALLESDKPVLTLAGPAGTGKTSMMLFLARMLREHRWSIRWCSPTGKAASVLSQRTGEEVKTLHSLTYGKVMRNKDGELAFSDIKDVGGSRVLVICDEASMVDKRLGRDFRSAVLEGGGRILYVGDHEQLPPVNGGGWDADFGHPDALLSQVHRQALDSAVLRIATELRLGQIFRLPRETVPGQYRFHDEGSYADAADWLTDHVSGDSAVLCWTNRDRRRLNALTRHRLGLSRGPVLVAGERMLCLANNPTHGLMNGEVVELSSVRLSEDYAGGLEGKVVEVDWKGRPSAGPALVHTDLVGGDYSEVTSTLGGGATRKSWLHVDHGYSLTVHKSQGSQFNRVGIVFSDGAAYALRQETNLVARSTLFRRWLYTALTRARTEVVAFDVRRHR